VGSGISISSCRDMLQFNVSHHHLNYIAQGKVVACCRSPAAAYTLIKVASEYPDRIQIFPLDMEDQSSIDTFASIMARNYQRVDALFNVAGILGDGQTTSGPERSLASIERDWMEKTLAVNVVGPTMLIKAISPLMRSAGRRSVKMNTTSVLDDNQTDLVEIALPTGRPPTVIANLSARVGSISDNRLGGWYTYRLSKAALNQATRTMGHELKRQGTWIVALHPGTTDTELSKPFQGNVREGRLFPVEFTVCRS
jgi:NAD(P)-dependent dehydrogenase (short-subunit alcohol dehydrogenase family)